MARFLHKGSWFEEVSSRAHYETEFENILEQHSDTLFPDYHFLRFKCTVYSELDGDARRPDYALVHKDYRDWWVVEVELAHHSLEGHVIPQVRTLSRARYAQDEVDYMTSRHSMLDDGRLAEMCKGLAPRVLVVVNAPVEGWPERLSVLGAKLAVCQIFRSQRNEYVLRVNGEWPSIDEEVLTLCECNRYIHRFLRVHSPAALPVTADGLISLHHNGQELLWRRTETSDAVFLHALCDHDLCRGYTYEIVRNGHDRLVIRRASLQERRLRI